MTRLKGRNVLRDGFDDGYGAKYTDKGPEDGHEVACVLGLGLAVAEPARDGVREVLPWRRRHYRVEEAVNVEVPRVVPLGGIGIGGAHCQGGQVAVERRVMVSPARRVYVLGENTRGGPASYSCAVANVQQCEAIRNQQQAGRQSGQRDTAGYQQNCSKQD